MKTRFAVFGDLHITGEAPSSRLETDFLSFQLSLLHAAVTAAVNKGAEAVLLPGDVINRRRLPEGSRNAAIGGLIDVIRRSGIPWFTTVGQHDVMGHRSSTYATSSDLRLVETALNGQLTVLYNGASATFKGINIFGFAYGDPAQEALFAGRAVPAQENSIALVHASVYPEPFMNYLTVDNLSSWGYALQVHGDIHQGFAPRQVGPNGEGLALNMGVLTWMKRDEATSCPMPAKFALVDIFDEGGWELVETIGMPHPRPEDCFDMSSQEETVVEASEVCIQQAITAMHAARAMRGRVSEREILERLALSANNPAALQTAMTYMVKAEEALEKQK